MGDAMPVEIAGIGENDGFSTPADHGPRNCCFIDILVRKPVVGINPTDTNNRKVREELSDTINHYRPKVGLNGVIIFPALKRAVDPEIWTRYRNELLTVADADTENVDGTWDVIVIGSAITRRFALSAHRRCCWNAVPTSSREQERRIAQFFIPALMPPLTVWSLHT